MEAEYGLTASAYGENKGDETLAVMFSKEPVQNKEKSLAENRPIFEEKLFIKIDVPGDVSQSIHRRAKEQDKHRFPIHWQRFNERTGDQDLASGMPLSEWAQISRSQVEELTFYKIRTVEQLAAVADGNLQNMMGAVVLKQKAKDYLERSTSNEELAAQLKEAQAQIAELIALSKPALSTPIEIGEKPKRKRRTKAEMEAVNTASQEM
jgi:hypothetical protein